MTAAAKIQTTPQQDLTREVHRLMSEAAAEGCDAPKMLWARAFGVVAGALITRGIPLKQYEQLTRELTEAQAAWQQGHC